MQCLPLPLARTTGKESPVETHLALGEWSKQQFLFGLSRDVGYLLQLQRQERLLLKNKGLERMTGAMAHHCNNFLTIVAGKLELAQEEGVSQSKISGLPANALEGRKRAIGLGQPLLIHTGQFAEATSPSTLPSCAATVRPRQPTTCLIILPRKSTPPRPARWFPAGWTPGRRRHGSLEVSDTGCGIDKKQLINIFDPFYSEKFVGRGLGLPLALSLVKKLDGAIAVLSRPRQGATFQVLLSEIAPIHGNGKVAQAKFPLPLEMALSTTQLPPTA